jgi:hypothetical protein
MKSAIEQIRECKYLYLHAISEPSDNKLCVVLHEARIGGTIAASTLAAEHDPAVADMLAGSREILHDPECKVFNLSWPDYIGYSIQNECFSLPEPADSIGEGRLIVEYTKSVYLDYLAKSTFASADHPGPFKHWAMYCLNHTVDVASMHAPNIQVKAADR